MKTKTKDNIWLSCLVIFSLLVGIGIQGALFVQQRNRSIARAEESFESFVSMTEKKADALEAGEETFKEGLELNYENKLLRGEKLKDLELLILVNPWNALPESYDVQPVYLNDYAPELAYTNDMEMMNIRCAEALTDMMRDCVNAGYKPYICSAYRSHEKQQFLFDNKIQRLMAEGYDYEDAKRLAPKVVAYPGTSEHELGLSADIIDADYPYLVPAQEQMPAQIWLMENCKNYGFVLRYPSEKSEITGIIYEPWHYRYVGKEFAEDMYERDMCLEEYLKFRRGR